jgi:integrase
VASIRKRSWQTKRGELKSGWQVDYADQHGFRRRKMFSHKKNADAFALTAQLEVRDGTHVAESDSLTVAEAGENWIETAEAVDEPPLEPTTLEQYRQHLDLHIVPIIGKVKLAKLNVPVIRDFADKLRAAGRSSTMVKYVIRSLGSLLADAQERGNIVRNPVHEMRSRRHQRKNGRERRGNNLDIGVDIPTPEEIKLILQAVTGKDRVFLLTAVFSGLRASEMRGLPWKDINLRKGELKVTQRADRHRKIGPPKTEAAQRTIPLPPPVISALREWLPKGSARPRISQRQRQRRISHQHNSARLLAGAAYGRSGCENHRHQARQPFPRAEVRRLALAQALLCVVVHQSKDGRRIRVTAESCAVPVRAFFDHGDNGYIRPSFPAQ